MAQLFEYWDVNEDEAGKRWPNLSRLSTGAVMQALLRLGGRLTDSMVEEDDTVMDRYRLVSYRITLPVGRKEEFEEMTGYRLMRPGRVG